ncbi:MAG: hypothetical protein GY810_16270 [Aureispira sp.]|nr:hypothetical protein [Aureispira sp.]
MPSYNNILDDISTKSSFKGPKRRYFYAITIVASILFGFFYENQIYDTLISGTREPIESSFVIFVIVSMLAVIAWLIFEHIAKPKESETSVSSVVGILVFGGAIIIWTLVLISSKGFYFVEMDYPISLILLGLWAVPILMMAEIYCRVWEYFIKGK